MSDELEPRTAVKLLPRPDDAELGHALLRDRAKSMLFGSASGSRSKIGRFELERRLGRGGMGEVFLAHDEQLQRPVAIKFLHARLLDADNSARARSQREGQALARVSHPNVIEVFEVGEHEGRPYVAMEYVEGRTLQAWLDEAEPSWREIVQVFVEAGRGLLAAHRVGLIHRDFKPENVLISGTGDERRVRVLDFGLARLVGAHEQLLESAPTGDDQLTAAGTVLGTPAFMAPEQLRGEVADESSDQFSFCLALYCALWGREPFGGSGIEERLARIETAEAAPPPSGRARRRLWPILRRGLARERDRRWPDMEALLDALERAIAVRRRWVVTAVVIAAVGAGVGVGLELAADPEHEDGRHSACAFVGTRAKELRVRRPSELASVPYAEHSLAAVDTELARWSQAWLERRMAICESGEEGSERAACLDRAHRRARALVEIYEQADERTLEHAVDSLSELPSLVACDNEEALALGLEPVPDAIAARLQSHRDTLARARLLRRTGHAERARAVLDTLEREAAGLDYGPFAAELAVERAKLELVMGDVDPALAQLEAAAKLAERERHDRLATLTWTVLAYRAAMHRHEQAEVWLERAEVGAARLGSPKQLEPRLSCIRGKLLSHDPTRKDDARAAFEQGLAQLEDLEDEVWLGVGDDMTRDWRPVCLAGLARLAWGQAAIDRFEQALESAETIWGVSHPKTVDLSYDLAGLLLASSRRADQQRGVQMLERVTEHGSATSPQLHLGLAATAITDDELETARRHVAVARHLLSPLPPDDPQRAGPLLLDAAIAHASGDFELALAHYEDARTLLAAVEGYEVQLTQIERNRGKCLLRLGRFDAADAAFSSASSEGDDDMALERAWIALSRGQPQRARAILRDLPAPDEAPAAAEYLLVSSLARARSREALDCVSVQTELAAALDRLEADERVDIERLASVIKISASERRCLAWPPT